MYKRALYGKILLLYKALFLQRKENYNGEKRKLIYRNFGNIYIALVIDDLENELAMLDFVNVIVKVFDDIFHGVTETHIINNPEKVYLIMDELISGGMVIETNKNVVVKAYLDKINDNENYKFFQN